MTVPKVDLKVIQTVSPATTSNGVYDIKVDYSNLSRQPSPNSYFVLTLPDVTYQSVVTLAGESVYFSDDAGATAPTFDPTSINTAVWKTDVSMLSNPGKPTYIAVSMGTIAGFAPSQRVLFTVKATHRDGTPAVIGESLTSSVELTSNNIKAMPSRDADIANNTDSDVTKIPGIDLVATISGDVEGGYPGLAPGDTINYTINLANNGVSAACGVKLQQTIPSHLTASDSIATSLTSLTFTKNGETVKPVDPLGNEINIPLTATYTSVSGTVSQWHIGDTSGSNTDPDHYEQICLPAGAEIEWTTSYTVKNTTLDSTSLTTSVTASEDSSANEDVTSNNTDSTTTIAYRPDVKIDKTARSLASLTQPGSLVWSDDFSSGSLGTDWAHVGVAGTAEWNQSGGVMVKTNTNST